MKLFSRWSRREIAAISLVAMAAVALTFILSKAKRSSEAMSCQSNLKQMTMAMLQYNRDYDEMYPLARNWSDALLPYWKPTAEARQCPSRKDLSFGYAMHAGVVGLSMAALSDPGNTILFFDSDAGTPNRTDAGSSLPSSPRHPQGHSVSFLDAHTEFIEKPDMKYGYAPAQIAATRKEYEQRQRWYPKQNFPYSPEEGKQKTSASLQKKKSMGRTLTESEQQFLKTGKWPQ